MKTAISIPDDVFRSAEQFAIRFGVSRSRLLTTALTDYLKRHRGDRVTETLDRIYGESESNMDPSLASLQALSLRKNDGGNW